MPDLISVVGVNGEPLADAAERTLAAADLVVGAPRHLAAHAPAGRPVLPLDGDIGAVLDEIATADGRVCVLASGDPGFFGIVRPLAERFGREALDVRPAPSSVSMAFARLGVPWDDAVVVSAHGRPVAEAARLAAAQPKAAVLVSPDSPPEALGWELLALGAGARPVAVCSRLGDDDEQVELTDVAGLVARSWDPRSVVVLFEGEGVAADKTLAWGLPDARFDHRDGMVTKAEVRAVALGKLALPRTGVVWDVGAGSGSVAIECARLSPQVRVIAVERRADDAARARANAHRHDVEVEVVEGTAPEAFASLPRPDRAFVGGGGPCVLDAVLDCLRPGGRVVATYAALDRAVEAHRRLGRMVQVSVSRGADLPAGGVRLEAENPVFVAWGPGE